MKLLSAIVNLILGLVTLIHAHIDEVRAAKKLKERKEQYDAVEENPVDFFKDHFSQSTYANISRGKQDGENVETMETVETSKLEEISKE